jgi:oligopeptide transport system permease protein
MLNFILKKICIFIFATFLVSTITFSLLKVLPGDPFVQAEYIPEEVLKSLYAHYGLDQPILVQYMKYLKGVLTFNLGPSYIYQGRTVNQIIKDGLPVSALLAFQSLFLVLIVGAYLASFSVLRKNTWQETLIIVLTSIFISIPNFVLASLLQYFLAMKLNLFPVALFESFAHTILPTLTLSIYPTCFIARLMRNSLLEVSKQEYIQTAISKGLSKERVFFCHILKNSLLPVVTYLGPLLTYLITGSFVVERIFAIPGLGMWMIQSILSRDYTVIMGLTLFYSFLLLFLNLITDIICAILDPRIILFDKKERFNDAII